MARRGSFTRWLACAGVLGGVTAACNPSGEGGGESSSGGAAVATGGTATAGSAGAPATGGMAGLGGSGASAGTSTVIAQTLATCGVTLASSLDIGSEAVPTALTGLAWSPRAQACQSGGWDLLQCAGATVTLATGTTTVMHGTHPVDVQLWIRDDTVCCAVGNDGGTPGWVPMSCGPGILAKQTLEQCGIGTTGGFHVQQIPVPAELTGPNWGIKDTTCDQSGWDLGRCAGSTATFTSLAATATNAQGDPLTVWVAALGDTVCCVYGSDDASAPGIYPMSCPRDAG